jgi:hypothetical protein
MKEILIAMIICCGIVAAWSEQNYSYDRSTDPAFLENMTKAFAYPVEPVKGLVGQCCDGTDQIVRELRSKGFNVTYATYEGTWDHQGHTWCLVENPAKKCTWLAIDNLYGPINQTFGQYYRPQYSFGDYGQIESEFALKKNIDPTLIH